MFPQLASRDGLIPNGRASNASHKSSRAFLVVIAVMIVAAVAVVTTTQKSKSMSVSELVLGQTQICARGEYLDGGDCKPCPVNSYCPGNNEKISCPPRQHQLSPGKASCTCAGNVFEAGMIFSVFGASSPMSQGSPPQAREVTQVVTYEGGALACPQGRAQATLSGMDIEVGPDARLTVSAEPVSSQTGKIVIKTWQDSVIHATGVSYVTTCLPQTKAALINVVTPASAGPFGSGQSQVVKTVILDLRCGTDPKIVIGLSHIDITDTGSISLRLKTQASATKLAGRQVEASVTFITWQDSKIYSAGASGIVYCPEQNLGPQLFQTGRATFDPQSAAPLNSGAKTQRLKSVTVTFSTAMTCPKPIITASLTALDIKKNHNYRLKLEIPYGEISSTQFELHFVTWGNTIIYWAEASYIATCL